MRARTPLALALLVAAACQAGEEDMDDMPAMPAPLSAEESAAMAADWSAAMTADDAATAAAMYAVDAVTVGDDGDTYTGRAAIEARLAELAGAAGAVTVTQTGFGSSGDLAWSEGTYSAELAMADGSMTTQTFRYLVISRREPDGSWRIVRSMNAPPEAMAPGMD